MNSHLRRQYIDVIALLRIVPFQPEGESSPFDRQREASREVWFAIFISACSLHHVKGFHVT
jgi:hypothetical protein